MSLLLEGNTDNRDTLIIGLQEQVRRLDEALRLERSKVGQAEAGVKELRRILNPLYRALQAVFGEIEAMGLQEISNNGNQSQSNPKWDIWRNRFPGRGAELINLLLVSEQMNTKQLSTALKCDPRTLAQLVHKLKGAGILEKNGNMFVLKEI